VIVGDYNHARKAAGHGDHVRHADAPASTLPCEKIVLVKDAAHGMFREQPEDTNVPIRRFIECYRSQELTPSSFSEDRAPARNA
jgi:hypothetical protein